MKYLSIASALMLLPVVAAAQTPPAPSSPEDMRRLTRYAQCIARTRPDLSREFVGMSPSDRGYERAASRLYRPDSRCWDQLGEAGRNRALQVRFNARMFAGRMAEALLREDLAGGDLATRSALNPARPSIEARSEEEFMSICTVRAAPVEVAALFASEPASAEETAAVRAVAPRIGQCLRSGATGEFNRSAIRSMLALAAYRLVRHNMAPAAAVGGN